MEKEIVLEILLMLFLASLLTLSFNVATVNAAEPIVTAYHSREYTYYAEFFEDSVPNVELNGFHERAFTIRIEEGPEVYDAKIVMETLYSEDPHFPSIGWDPSADFTVTALDSFHRYEWAFHDPVKSFEMASAWLYPTNLPVTFKPEFDSKRTIEPILITSLSVTQTLTIKVTPSIYFYYFTVHSTLWETDEVIPTVVPGSASPDFLEVEQPDLFRWTIPYSIVPGKEYTFSVQINVENKRYPDPVFYKPELFIQGWVDEEVSVFPSTESVAVYDDVLQGPVTYSGKGPQGEFYDWKIVDWNMNKVGFPHYSSIVPMSAIIDIEPDTVNLVGNGKWVTAYIELPDNHYPDEIDTTSIQLQGFLPMDPDAPTDLGDFDGDGVLDLMVKFDRAEVQEYLGGSATIDYGDETMCRYEVALWISGSLFDGTFFAGTDTIWVISK